VDPPGSLARAGRAAHDDDLRAAWPAAIRVRERLTPETRQREVEQDQVRIALATHGQRRGAVGCLGSRVAGVSKRGADQAPEFIVVFDDQHASRIRYHDLTNSRSTLSWEEDLPM